MKPVHFVGTSREDLREFPDSAQETAGFQLFKVQQGKEPDDCSQKTAQPDLDLGKSRYADLLKWRREEGR